LVGLLVEMTHLCDESTDWARGGAAMAQVNGNRCAVLEKAVEVAVKLVQPMGLSLHEQALSLPTRTRDVMA
jgi:hypothetical protein